MMELLGIYKFAFLLCPLAAALLCVFGTHLVSRNESLQLMALSQAALAGNILGHLGPDSLHLAGFILSLVVFVGIKLAFLKVKSVSEQFYVVVYLSFVALTYFIVSLFPGLDSHFALGFFGDIVSISVEKSIVLSVLFLGLLVMAVAFKSLLLKSTMEKSVFRQSRISFYEEAFFISGILFSLYELGFLFTLAFMIFPVMIAGNVFKNLSQCLWSLALVSGLASMVGLTFSIVFSRVSTVPVQVLILLVFLAVTRLVFTKYGKLA